MDISLNAGAEIEAVFLGARHDIVVEIPDNNIIVAEFQEQSEQILILNDTPTISVEIASGPPTSNSSGVLISADQYGADSQFLYFGFASAPWFIRRVARSGGARTIATAANNSGIIDFPTAWAQIDTLTYEVSV